MAILKEGLSGEPVRRLQTKLGANTEEALKEGQTANGLTADGAAGSDTFMAMGLYMSWSSSSGVRAAILSRTCRRGSALARTALSAPAPKKQ